MTLFSTALCLAAPLLSPTSAADAPAPGDLLVSSRNTDEVLWYDAAGAFMGVFAAGGGLDNPVGLTFGPDGHLYVASGDTDQVLRYDGTTGAFLDVFAEGGGLSGTRQVNFGPDGNLYVASGAGDEVLRYHGESGEFLDVFASGHNLDGPTSFTFGPDGHLYVVSVIKNRVKRYHGRTGVFLGNFVKTRLNGPHDVGFGPDGLLYVTNAFNTRIRRYDPTTGDYVDDFVADSRLSAPLGMTWDAAGDLLVANQGRNEVRRYDGRTGAFLGTQVRGGAGGLSSPLFQVFVPEPTLGLAASERGAADSRVELVGARPGGRFLLLAGDHLGSRPVTGCGGLEASLRQPTVAATLIADEGGRAMLRGAALDAFAGRPVWLQALSPRDCQISPLVEARFLALPSTTTTEALPWLVPGR